MTQKRQKTVSGEVLTINGVLAGLVLAAGGVSYLAGLDWIREPSGGMLCLYSGALLVFMAAVYVTDKLWQTQALTDMLSALGLPQLLRQSPMAGTVYKVVLTVLLWAVLAAVSLLPEQKPLAIAAVPMIIIWLAFVRVMVKAEQSPAEKTLQLPEEEPADAEAAEKRSLAFWGAWLIFMLAVLYKLGWGVLHLYKYQWLFAAMPGSWQRDLAVAAAGAGLGILAAIVYAIIAKVQRARRKETVSE